MERVLFPLLTQESERVQNEIDLQDLVVARRLVPYRGAELKAADFALSAGWGATATVSAIAVGSGDARARVTVLANGAGVAANPTITLTFRDGKWRQAPFGIVSMNGGTGAQAVPTWAFTTGTLVITYPLAPVAGLTYVFEFVVLG